MIAQFTDSWVAVVILIVLVAVVTLLLVKLKVFSSRNDRRGSSPAANLPPHDPDRRPPVR